MGVNSRYKDSVFSSWPVNSMVYPGGRIGRNTETGWRCARNMGENTLTMPVCTCQTANPATPGPIFIQIYGFGDNPLKYTDLDGRDIKGTVRGLAKAIGGALSIAGGIGTFTAFRAEVTIDQ